LRNKCDKNGRRQSIFGRKVIHQILISHRTKLKVVTQNFEYLEVLLMLVMNMFVLTGIILLDFALGILVGEILDFIYDQKCNNKENEIFEGYPKIISFFHWLEHYHWGMLLLLYYFPFLNGFGLSLILDENRSDCRFGWEKPENRDEYYHFIQSSAIGGIIFTLLIIRWICSLR